MPAGLPITCKCWGAFPAQFTEIDIPGWTNGVEQWFIHSDSCGYIQCLRGAHTEHSGHGTMHEQTCHLPPTPICIGGDYLSQSLVLWSVKSPCKFPLPNGDTWHIGVSLVGKGLTHFDTSQYASCLPPESGLSSLKSRNVLVVAARPQMSGTAVYTTTWKRPLFSPEITVWAHNHITYCRESTTGLLHGNSAIWQLFSFQEL